MKHLSNSQNVAKYRNTADERDLAGLLQTRAHLLTGQDRALLTMYLENGGNFCQMARLAGLCATSIARKIRRIAERLVDETYPMCLRHRDQFSDLELAIAKDYFVRGRSMTRISQARNVTYYCVRKTVQKTQRFADLVRSLPFEVSSSGLQTSCTDPGQDTP